MNVLKRDLHMIRMRTLHVRELFKKPLVRRAFVLLAVFAALIAKAWWTMLCWQASRYDVLRAVMNRDANTLERLLEDGANPNSHTDYLDYAYLWDVQDLMDLVNGFLRRRDFIFEKGTTALIMAIENEDVASTRLLMRHGADPSVRDYSGFSANAHASSATNREIDSIVKGG